VRNGKEITFVGTDSWTTILEARTGRASQLHALGLADVDGDGLLDIVTGSAGGRTAPTGSATRSKPEVWWFRLELKRAASRLVPHLVDDASGVGVTARPAASTATGTLTSSSE
jgi:hypothetical protein